MLLVKLGLRNREWWEWGLLREGMLYKLWVGCKTVTAATATGRRYRSFWSRGRAARCYWWFFWCWCWWRIVIGWYRRFSLSKSQFVRLGVGNKNIGRVNWRRRTLNLVLTFPIAFDTIITCWMGFVTLVKTDIRICENKIFWKECTGVLRKKKVINTYFNSKLFARQTSCSWFGVSPSDSLLRGSRGSRLFAFIHNA